MNSTYTINVIKTSPDHWIITTILNVKPLKIEVVVGGKSIREGIINSINAFKKKVTDEDIGRILNPAIEDLEKIL